MLNCAVCWIVLYVELCRIWIVLYVELCRIWIVLYVELCRIWIVPYLNCAVCWIVPYLNCAVCWIVPYLNCAVCWIVPYLNCAVCWIVPYVKLYCMLNSWALLVLLILSTKIQTTMLLHERDHSIQVLQFHQRMLLPYITCYSKLSGCLVILYPASGMQCEQTYCNVASITGTHFPCGIDQAECVWGAWWDRVGGGLCSGFVRHL
jgi:hypothetical protein